jgi:tuftelin-interacting protein 11
VWKGLLSLEILANDRIRNQLNVGLEMMNQVVEGITVKEPDAKENVSYLKVTKHLRHFSSSKQQHMLNIRLLLLLAVGFT